jgi:hypothetical protein
MFPGNCPLSGSEGYKGILLCIQKYVMYSKRVVLMGIDVKEIWNARRS